MTKPSRMRLRFALALPSWLRFSRFWCCHLAFCWRFSRLDPASLPCSRPKIQRIFSGESWHENVPGILGKTVPQGRKCPSDLVQNNICEGRGETRNHTTCKPVQAITILYIGGASATSSLLSCQEFDGNRDASAIFWHTLMFLVLGFDI